ncbi:MAG: mechanosensitive ion channel family protein [Thermoplasmatota archaeon]
MTNLASPFLPEVYATAIVLVTWVIAHFASRAIGRTLRQSTPRVAFAIQRLSALLVWIVGLTIAIQQLGVSTDAVLVTLSLLGVACIVAFRAPLENFGAKYFADIYVPFKAGDSIRIGDATGKVIEMNSMSTVLLSDDEHIIAVPNSQLLRHTLTNVSPLAWKEILIPVSINPADLAGFESELRKSLSKIKFRLDDHFPPILTRKGQSPLSTEFVLTVMVRSPEDRDMITAEVNKRVSEALLTVQKKPRPAG